MLAEDWRIGIGYDLHTVVGGRPLVLGGVPIVNDFGLAGHSDGDVMLHALIDALFGAAGLPDIGEHFPDTDDRFKGVSSTEMLGQAVAEIRGLRWTINNVDLTILAEKPKMSPYKSPIARSIAELLTLDVQRISIKAKTNEGCDAVGQGRALACHVALTLKRGA